jgi:hypothetical protein
MGFITSYLSTSFISAFTTTGGIHIISSQIPNALGIKIPTINKQEVDKYEVIKPIRNIPITSNRIPTMKDEPAATDALYFKSSRLTSGGIVVTLKYLEYWRR